MHFAVTWYLYKTEVEGAKRVALSLLKDDEAFAKICATDGFSTAVLRLSGSEGATYKLSGLSSQTVPFFHKTGKSYIITFDYYVKTAASGSFCSLSGDKATDLSGDLFGKTGVAHASIIFNADGTSDNLAFVLAGGAEVYIGNVNICACDNVNPSLLQLIEGHTFKWDGVATIENGETVKVADITDPAAKDAILAAGALFGDTVAHLDNGVGNINVLLDPKYYTSYSTYNITIDAYIASKSDVNVYLIALDSTPTNKLITEGLFIGEGLYHTSFDWTVGNTGEYQLIFYINGKPAEYPDIYIGNITVKQAKSPRPDKFLTRSDYNMMTKEDLAAGYIFDFGQNNLCDLGKSNYVSLNDLSGDAATRMKTAGFGDTLYYFDGNVTIKSLENCLGDGKPVTVSMKIYDVKGNIAGSLPRGAFVLLNMTNGVQNSAEVNYTIKVDPNESRILTVTFKSVPPAGTDSLLLYKLTGCEFFISSIEVK